MTIFKPSFMLPLTIATLLSTVAWAQIPPAEYFPLQTGNSWVFRSIADNPNLEPSYRTISVGGKETIRDREYFNVRYFDRSVALRAASDGSIVAFNRTSGAEEPWLQLGLPAGSTFESHIDQCVETGRIESRTANVTTPLGEFRNALRVSFQGNCFDAGVTEQHYVAGLGPVTHTESNFAGPLQYRLVYVRAGSSNVTTQELSFTVALDSRVYRVGGTMGVRLTARSTHPQPIRLHFPSGQSFDLKIFDESGKVVYVWSAARIFPMIIRDEQFGPGELSYAFSVPLNGTGLPLGHYRAQAYLTTNPMLFLGEVPFEISEFLP
jgi:hypothetical protein